MSELASTEEIQVHIDQLNKAWQEYNRIHQPTRTIRSAARLAELGSRYMQEIGWLYEHGLSDVHGEESITTLDYDEEEKAYSLPLRT